VTLSGLVDLFCTEPTITRTIGDARGGRQQVLDVTSPAPMRPFIAAALAATKHRGGADRPVLIVTSTYREAEGVTATLACLLGEDEVAYYPAWETLPHERLSPRSDTAKSPETSGPEKVGRYPNVSNGDEPESRRPSARNGRERQRGLPLPLIPIV